MANRMLVLIDFGPTNKTLDDIANVVHVIESEQISFSPVKFTDPHHKEIPLEDLIKTGEVTLRDKEQA